MSETRYLFSKEFLDEIDLEVVISAFKFCGMSLREAIIQTAIAQYEYEKYQEDSHIVR